MGMLCLRCSWNSPVEMFLNGQVEGQPSGSRDMCRHLHSSGSPLNWVSNHQMSVLEGSPGTDRDEVGQGEEGSRETGCDVLGTKGGVN